VVVGVGAGVGGKVVVGARALPGIRAVGVAEEAVQIHGDQQLGPDPTRLGQPPALKGAATQFGQGVGGPLAP
jgi:hypothetical protein